MGCFGESLGAGQLSEYATYRTDRCGIDDLQYFRAESLRQSGSFYKEFNIGIIARRPFNEATLSGMFIKETTFPASNWRSMYFVPENLNSSVDHADTLKPLISQG
ncbi:hypothetical protein [Spirosoma validum]|uniref:Uncharacterized protein n=1 Tax=Spirosoma validum TaxID=2771355 RepID=A0A927GHE1_9BACT|nr:hypothetical protein [Spirosoma validum]MBD2757628.1 hypothetical protein [Spirosoma validum]